jgi:hypothetical protein
LKLKDILEALDNELQHHRIYPQFAAAEFPAEVFYNDNDKSSFKLVRAQVRK